VVVVRGSSGPLHLALFLASHQAPAAILFFTPFGSHLREGVGLVGFSGGLGGGGVGWGWVGGLGLGWRVLRLLFPTTTTAVVFSLRFLSLSPHFFFFSFSDGEAEVPFFLETVDKRVVFSERISF